VKEKRGGKEKERERREEGERKRERERERKREGGREGERENLVTKSFRRRCDGSIAAILHANPEVSVLND